MGYYASPAEIASPEPPALILTFAYDGVTPAPGGGFRGATPLFGMTLGDGRLAHGAPSVSNGAGDVTFSLASGFNPIRAIAVDFDGVAATCTITTNTVRVVFNPAKRVLLAVWG